MADVGPDADLMPGPSRGVEITGLADFRRDLRELGKQWPAELAKVHRTAANEGARLARAAATGMGGVQAKAAPAIKGYGTASSASVGIASGARYPMANVAFWGGGRSGWYQNPRYAGSSGSQFKPWVGAGWQPAVTGQGPYAINDALAAYLPHFVRTLEQMLDDLTARAFPS